MRKYSTFLTRGKMKKEKPNQNKTKKSWQKTSFCERNANKLAAKRAKWEFIFALKLVFKRILDNLKLIFALATGAGASKTVRPRPVNERDDKQLLPLAHANADGWWSARHAALRPAGRWMWRFLIYVYVSLRTRCVGIVYPTEYMAIGIVF